MSTEENRTLSSEETDHLQRSTKKIKSNDNCSCSTDAQGLDERSFRQTLLWGRKDVAGIEEMGNIDKMTFDLNDETMIDFESDEELGDDSMPSVKFSLELRKSMQRPWLSALIVKLVGKTLSFTTLEARAMRLWAPEGEVDFIDLGSGYYVVKFECQTDVVKVLTGGPWKIMDHYLHVQRWKPNFRPSTASLGPTAVWIRLPELPLEYFHEEALFEIGGKIGKPLKLDANTRSAARGKFARICVEVDLSKALIPRVRVGNLVQVIEYEAMHVVCFKCGLFGHRLSNCPQRVVVNVPAETQGEPPSGATASSPSDDRSGETQSQNFGPWMLVQRKSRNINFRGKSTAKIVEETQGNRFEVLNAGENGGNIIATEHADPLAGESIDVSSGPATKDGERTKLKGKKLNKASYKGEPSNGYKAKPLASGPGPKVAINPSSRVIGNRPNPTTKSKTPSTKPLPVSTNLLQVPDASVLVEGTGASEGGTMMQFSHQSDPPEVRLQVPDTGQLSHGFAAPLMGTNVLRLSTEPRGGINVPRQNPNAGAIVVAGSRGNLDMEVDRADSQAMIHGVGENAANRDCAMAIDISVAEQGSGEQGVRDLNSID